ncbi:MAG: phage tail sheath C-terminal domain-containing protein [Pseudomonadota bacterium]
MTTYRTPGVYVEEIPLFPPSVAEVETAIPAFIGYTQKAKKNVDNDLYFVPTRISSLVEYETLFGGPPPPRCTVDLVEDAVNHSFTITKVNPDADNDNYLLYYSIKMFFANGGGPCYVVSVGDYSISVDKGSDGASPSGLMGGLAKIAAEDEPTIIVIPDAVRLATATDHYEVMDMALLQCSTLQDRVALVDVYSDVKALRDTISGDLACLKYGAAYYPWLVTSIAYDYDGANVIMSASSGSLADKALNSIEIKAQNNSLYNQIKAELGKNTVTLPPGGAIAGVYARVDASRGVWKAPANVALYGVIKPSVRLTDAEQASLNVNSDAGKSVNAIRAFTGKGILVWGARTLAGNDNEWRYIPVRRFFNMVEESVKKATYWAVFEPNDANTWIKVKSMIENYLVQKWRDGALTGAKPDEAFFVKVGLGVTMTAQDILEGRMNIEIGMAVVRPAEFIILKFSHKMQTS